MSKPITDIQGRFLTLPYDFRRPTIAKALGRFWNPGGPMLSPKVFGWGFAPNLAHRGTWLMFGAILTIALFGALAG